MSVADRLVEQASAPARRGGRWAWTAAAAVVLLVMAVLSIRFGSRDISTDDFFAALFGDRDALAHAVVARRIPRTVLAMAVGAALAVSGLAMQAVTRNPLADPGILGVNMGASLAVVVGMAFFSLTTASSYVWTAIVGAAVTAVFVYAVGSMGRGGATPLKLALSGAAISAALSSLVIATVLPRNDIAGSVRSWQIGGVGGGTWNSLRLIAPFLAVGFVVCWSTARSLNSLALGDETASGLGEHVTRTRVVASFGAVVLCGAATAIAGPIGFVGLVVPHVCRLLLGVDHRWTMPIAAVVGAALLTASDIVGRVIAGDTEVEVGIITSLIGAPVFIYIVRRQRIRSL
ncbi:FecCD family ABC transporter permease [Gordonia humi]|uniref:Iron complex transport system permease protein n=1 Tax=Gordonia humi TaxID=686429 RepID=A0A840EYG5_9ACTN|nr:iron complex transport system permease protein [Gordonia humi]